MRQATRERQARVLSELLDKKHVTIRDLADGLEVSEATVRRDLKSLSDAQKIHLVHGGAMLPADKFFSFEAKHDRNLDAKRVIGQLAAELVEDGDHMFLDSGTTSFNMAGPLSAKRGLSIIVNSARLALEIKSPSMNLIMIGGQYRPDRMDTVGPIAIATLEQLRGYVAYLGADGLSQDFGVSAADIESAHIYRTAVANARETNLLVDHSKFKSASLFKIIDWEHITRLITDRPPTPEWQAFLNDRKIEVIHPDNIAERAEEMHAHAAEEF